MDERQFAELMNILTEIRDDQKSFIRLMQEPVPEPVHVHAPADGSSPAAPFWVCKCGYVHDDERSG